jgi:hypothetical protein
MDGHPLARGVLVGGSLGMFSLALLLGPSKNIQPFIYFQF